jgi:chemotaxis protein MotB
MSKKGRHEEHEHENEERWLISYADFITLLMALFIVMYAMSSTNAEKFQKLAVSLNGAFNVPSRSPVNMPSLPGRTGDTLAPILKERPDPPTSEQPPSPDAPSSLAPILEMQQSLTGIQGKETTPPGEDPEEKKAPDAKTGAQPEELTEEVLEQARQQIAMRERRNLEQVKEQIDSLLALQGLESQATVTISKSGRVLNLRLPENQLFGIGSADLSSEASIVLDKMATIIDRSGQSVRIEGHTDNLPVRSGRFASNWDLSTARATRVLLYLQEAGGISPSKLAAAGYGEHRPIADNGTPEGRAKNRRVEFVITAEDQGI